MSAPHVWLNGRLLPAADAALGVAERGFLLGDGLFETMRAYGGRVFRLDAHLARLARGAERTGIPLPSGLRDAVLKTLHSNDLGEAAIRLTLSRGPAGHGLEPAGEAVPATVLITVRPYRADPALYELGLRAVTAAGRLDARRATAGLKQTGYLEAILALRQARAAGADEALFLDTDGHVAEASASNVFALIGGALWTPPLSCGALPGITRATVIDLAPGLGLEVREEPLPPSALAGAAEAFLTSSLREIVPLVALDGMPIGAAGSTSGSGPGPAEDAQLADAAAPAPAAAGPGPITLKLLAAYRMQARSGPEGAA